jgi:lipoic acid synthetase
MFKSSKKIIKSFHHKGTKNTKKKRRNGEEKKVLNIFFSHSLISPFPLNLFSFLCVLCVFVVKSTLCFSMINRLPQWLTKKYRDNDRLHSVKAMLRKRGLNTVCESARCPNIAECFSKPTATFMILGNVCTRSCGFCSVDKGYPAPPSDNEPVNVAEASLELGLRHVVITSVTRDDLPDKGAGQFARTIDAIRKINRGKSVPASLPPNVSIGGSKQGGQVASLSLQACPRMSLSGAVSREGKDYICPTIEVLTPDFSGSAESIRTVAERKPEIYNHNLETVPRLYKTVRPRADYERSLNLFGIIKNSYPDIITKSGIMVGLGERTDEVIAVLKDLRKAGCDVVTIGQYLMPTKNNLPVVEYIEPQLFAYYKSEGENMGFKQVESGPFVRSSYNARMINNVEKFGLFV